MTDQELCDELRGDRWQLAADRIEQLAGVIKWHRSQKADDRCIEDDDKLYEALGDGIKCDRRVGDKEDMKHNCHRFIDNRCEGGGWPSYAELERLLMALIIRFTPGPPDGIVMIHDSLLPPDGYELKVTRSDDGQYTCLKMEKKEAT